LVLGFKNELTTVGSKVASAVLTFSLSSTNNVSYSVGMSELVSESALRLNERILLLGESLGSFSAYPRCRSTAIIR